MGRVAASVVEPVEYHFCSYLGITLILWRTVFGNKHGLVVIDLTEDDEDDDLVVMQRQHEMRMVAVHQKVRIYSIILQY